MEVPEETRSLPSLILGSTERFVSKDGRHTLKQVAHPSRQR